jgi:uncharacterized protein YdbL (DUF1318 family)
MIFSKKGVSQNMLSIFVIGALLVGSGCARVEVQAPKDPIKMDISMRLDVYQHVVKDIDQIENLVSGSGQKTAWAEFLVTTAYAEDLDPRIEQAAAARRDRRESLLGLEAQGALGESNLGLVVVRSTADGADAIASSENNDRMVIYEALAQKNGTSVQEIQKVYSERLHRDAPAGTPVQDASGNWGTK